ncbi:hypothetical protein HPB49_016174 [Dermacentor silvarum]|uniref:Uncharacterized protein n=1 Tax=Dermacentor silvarum TaxID=543639 RepID=A0ACB8CS68_DERSI|nr:hypothetical protein HPB49_016174 [Dermacentor silvarum]
MDTINTYTPLKSSVEATYRSPHYKKRDTSQNYILEEQWGPVCNSLNGQLGCKKTWHLLRHLLDPGNTKSAARNQMTKIIHQYPGTDAELLAELASRYINTSSQSDTHLPHYVGAPNKQLDADISEAALRYTSCARLTQVGDTRVLGMILLQNRRNGITIDRLQMTVKQTTRLLHRAPSNAYVTDNKVKKRSKKKSKYNTFQSATIEIKEALPKICGGLYHLVRPIAHPKTTKRIATPNPGPMSYLGPLPPPPAPPQAARTNK